MKKRFLAVFLALVMAVGMLPMAALAAGPTSGTCGDSLSWKFESGVLTISGTGKMHDFSDMDLVDTPWEKSTSLIKEVVLDHGVTSIGERAFNHCANLTRVVIPDTVTRICSWAFSDCGSLTEISIPDSVTVIGREAFSACSSLTSVSIPDGVTRLAFGTFMNCPGLTSVTIPDSVSSIEQFAFQGCTGLTSVTIPNSVSSIEQCAFADCTGLKDVYYDGSEANWTAITIGSDNDHLTSAAIHYNSTGPDQPSSPGQPALPTVEDIPAAGTAVARTQSVKLDGRDVEFQCYAVKNAQGDEANYVKVRDLAQAVNGTAAQFNVGWDGRISITSGSAYEAVGGEGTTPYSGDQPYMSVSGTPVSFNGEPVDLTSFSITYQGGGYTYYKLRDLGQLLGFNVKWDGSSVVIETDKPYTGE